MKSVYGTKSLVSDHFIYMTLPSDHYEYMALLSDRYMHVVI